MRQGHKDFSISQLRPSKPGMGTEVSPGQETSREHPGGMSHPSRWLCCWELGRGSPWECWFPSLLGEMPASQIYAWWEVGQQIPEGPPFPAVFLCFNGHRAGNTDGQRNSESQNSHPLPTSAPPPHLHRCLENAPEQASSLRDKPPTLCPSAAGPGGRRSLRTGCLHSKVHDETGKAEPGSLP